MDIGYLATCQRCTQKFNIYTETHGGRGKWRAGMCPRCNAMVSVKVSLKDGGFIYPDVESKIPVTPLPYYAGDK